MIDIDALKAHMQENNVSATEQAATLAEAHRRNAAESGLHPQADILPTQGAPQYGAPGHLAGPPSIQRTIQSLPGPIQSLIAPKQPPPGTMTGGGAAMGEAVGGGLAAMAIPTTGGLSTLAIPAMATGGAMAGHTLESVLARGTVPSWQELAAEGALSLIPEGVESGVRAAGRKMVKPFLRAGVEGRILRHSEQYRRATAAATGTFNAPSKEAVDKMFKEVRALGKQLDSDEFALAIERKYKPGERTTIKTELGHIDAEVGRRTGRIGDKRFQELYDQILESLKPPKKGNILLPSGQPHMLDPLKPPKIDLGDAQDLRSGIRVRLDTYSPNNADKIDLMQDFKRDVDDMIVNKLTADPSDPAYEMLKNARNQYHRFAASEDAAMFYLKHSSNKVGPEGRTYRELNLNGMMDDLAKNQSKAAQSLNRHLDTIPEARANFERMVGDLGNLQMFVEPGGRSQTGLRNIPLYGPIMTSLGEIMLSREGTAELTQRVLRNGGQITPNMLAEVMSTVRRTQAPEMNKAVEQAMPQITDQHILEAFRRLMMGNVPSAE